MLQSFGEIIVILLSVFITTTILIMDNSMKGLGYLGAFLGGALAGAALGILMAPEKGSATREKISGTVDEFLEKHNIKLNRKEKGDFVDDLEEAAE